MRLGTQLLVLSLGLLALPWLGYRYLEEMQGFLLRGYRERQEEARLLLLGVLVMVLPVSDREGWF